MTAAKQLAANRRNARKSSGPRSDEGKARSSQNALKHGLSAERVVIWDEDPAAFEALRSALFEHYQPADPIADHLVEHVAACIWRLRRVPEIEAGIYSHFMQEPILERYLTAMDEDDAAAEGGQDREGSAKGKVFEKAERSLSSLARLAGSIESSMYRANRELERMKAERSEGTNGSRVIDVEPEQEERVQRPRPRLRKALAAKQDSDATRE